MLCLWHLGCTAYVACRGHPAICQYTLRPCQLSIVRSTGRAGCQLQSQVVCAYALVVVLLREQVLRLTSTRDLTSDCFLRRRQSGELLSPLILLSEIEDAREVRLGQLQALLRRRIL